MHTHFRRISILLVSVLAGVGAAACSSSTPKTTTTATPPTSSQSSGSTSATATYDGNLSRTGYVNDTSLTASNSAKLAQKWHLSVSTPISAQPIVDDGTIYWADWDGNMHATTLAGKDLWSTSLQVQPKPAGCIYNLATLGILSTPTIGTVGGTRVLWAGGGNGQMVELNAATGKIMWQTDLKVVASNDIWSSPAYYNGSLYVGVASWQGCPQVFGRFVKLDATTGAVQGSINFSSLVAAKCDGPGVWSSPSVDPSENAIYFGTSNDVCDSQYQDAIVRVDATTLAISSIWQVPVTQHPADSDFGASPMLFTATIGGVQRQLVGDENKNGVYYVLDRDNLASGPLWQYRIESAAAQADATCNNTLSTSGWAGANAPVVVAGVSLSGSTCIGTITALDPATGQLEWQVPLSGGIEGAVTEVPGLVLVGAGRDFDVLSSSNGATLFSFTEPLPTSGDTGLYGAPKYWFWGPPTVSGSTVLVANQDGNLRAFAP